LRKKEQEKHQEAEKQNRERKKEMAMTIAGWVWSASWIRWTEGYVGFLLVLNRMMGQEWPGCTVHWNRLWHSIVFPMVAWIETTRFVFQYYCPVCFPFFRARSSSSSSTSGVSLWMMMECGGLAVFICFLFVVQWFGMYLSLSPSSSSDDHEKKESAELQYLRQQLRETTPSLPVLDRWSIHANWLLGILLLVSALLEDFCGVTHYGAWWVDWAFEIPYVFLFTALFMWIFFMDTTDNGNNNSMTTAMTGLTAWIWIGEWFLGGGSWSERFPVAGCLIGVLQWIGSGWFTQWITWCRNRLHGSFSQKPRKRFRRLPRSPPVQ
jgi:cation transport ATPase